MCRGPIFNAPEGAGGGCCVPGAPENASRTTEGCSAHTNICSVPEKGVSGTEYHSRTREACSAHRVPLKMRRVPQKPVFCTARIFRTREGPLRYRIFQTARKRRALPAPNTTNARKVEALSCTALFWKRVACQRKPFLTPNTYSLIPAFWRRNSDGV